MGALTVVGSGMTVAGQVTEEARSAIERAEKLFHLVQSLLMHRWLAEMNPTAESLYDAYADGKSRATTYDEIVERILAPVRAGRDVCAVFYGHPGVFARPSHEAVRRAREEGHSAIMLPGISAEDCLIADLGFDPGAQGCQSFEATDFLVRRRIFDPGSALLLWQIGGIGVSEFRARDYWNPRGVEILARTLAETFGEEHEVVVYEAAVYPVAGPTVHRCRLADLPAAPITIASTLLVPPREIRPVDRELLARLTRPEPGRPAEG